MILMIALAVTVAFLWLCAKPMKAHPAPFYLTAALISAAVIVLYWVQPDFLTPALRSQLPIWLSAFGTACFIFVMYVGALPNGHPVIKWIMPIRGELSIFACLLTLGHNLSFGKNYLTPGYLFSGPVSATKIAAWISAILILLMLVLTITSVKAVRKRFQPKKWKALQRSAYAFYALIYVHVLLMTIPSLLRGRPGYGLNLLVYSVVFLSYAACRIQKAALVKNHQAAKATGRRQLAAAGVGVVLSVALLGGTSLAANAQNSASPADLPEDNLSKETVLPEENGGETALAPLNTSAEVPDSEPAEVPLEEQGELPSEASEEPPEEEPVEDAAPVSDADEKPDPTPAAGPAEEPAPEPQPTIGPAPEPVPEPAPEPVPAPEQEPVPEPEPEPAPAAASKYQDGTFTGTGEGYNGTVTVEVTISGDKITAISVTSHSDEGDYMDSARKGVVSSILLTQSTNVAAVSGATYSSEGILDAVDAALAKAAN